MENKEKGKHTHALSDRSEGSCDAIQGLPRDGMMLELADFFKLFADSTRVRILAELDRDELCVCDISNALLMTKSAVSHQLKILRDGNLVKCERRGKHIYYSLADSHVKDIIEKAIEHIEE